MNRTVRLPVARDSGYANPAVVTTLVNAYRTESWWGLSRVLATRNPALWLDGPKPVEPYRARAVAGVR